jgi:hypothetical protein
MQMKLSDRNRVTTLISNRQLLSDKLKGLVGDQSTVLDFVFRANAIPHLNAEEFVQIQSVLVAAATREMQLVEAGLERLGVTIDMAADEKPAGKFFGSLKAVAPAPVLSDPRHVAEAGVAGDVDALRGLHG